MTVIQNTKIALHEEIKIMFKKALLVNIIMATSSTIVLAATPYVGGGLGLTDVGIYNGGNIQTGVIGKLFGGYGSTFGASQNIYLGGELNIDLARYRYYSGITSGSTYGLGVSFIPGLMLTTSTMLYGRVGIEADRNTDSSTSNLGNQLGLGVQTNLASNWDMRGEYIHTSTMGGNSQINLGLVYKFN